MRLRTYFFLCVLTAAIPAPCIPFEYRLAVNGVLDNREFGHGQGVDQTFFFVRPEAEIGGRIDGNHKIRGGLTHLQEFGAPTLAKNLHLLAYYHYDSEWMQFRFGSFPQDGAVDAPEWFFGGEAAYYRPFAHGAAVSAELGDFGIGAWVDWIGRQSETVNEAFLFGYGAKFNRGIFTIRHDFVMYHHALTLMSAPGEFVRDNGGASAEAVVSWGRIRNYVDTLSLSVGGIAGLVRNREDGIWHTPIGGIAGGYAGSGFLAVRGLMYVGEPQSFDGSGAFFSKFCAETYGRLDIIARFAKNENIRAELFQSFHVIDGELGYSQHFLVHAEIGNADPPVKRRRRGFRINVRWD